jgi:glutathione S-transferase
MGFSHFCEKARWALDLSGLPFVEESHAPLLHAPFVLAAGGKRSVPVLVDTASRQVFADSTDILLEVDRRAAEVGLYPKDPGLRAEVVALVAAFDRVLGPATRRIGYYHLLRGGERYGREMFRSSARSGTRAFVHAAYPLLAAAVAKVLRVDEEGYARSMQRLRQTYEEVDARLEAAEREGRSWLVGDTFTAADLTFAALSGPLLAPPERGFACPPANLLPPDVAVLVDPLRATRAGRHAQKTYATQRRLSLRANPAASPR